MYVSETKFKCTYYTYIFEYDRDISEMYLKVYNRLDKKSLDILLNQISEEDYRRASIPIDRKAILREKYGCTTEYKPLYTYIFSDELIPMIRDYYDKDMDEFEKVKIGLGWLQEHIKHSPKDNFVIWMLKKVGFSLDVEWRECVVINGEKVNIQVWGVECRG